LNFRNSERETHLKLLALLDAEEASGRFGPSEISFMRNWERALIFVDPGTAWDVFSACYGQALARYESEIQRSIEDLDASALAAKGNE